MADLTAKGRAALPSKDFAGKGKTFPVENNAHARAALSGASRAEHAGNISKAQESKIDAKADAKLDKGSGMKTHNGSKHHVSYR